MQGMGTAPLASGGAGGESFEAAVRLAPTLPPSAVLFPWPPLLFGIPAKAFAEAGDRGHPPGHPPQGFSKARTSGRVSSQLPPLLTCAPPPQGLFASRPQCMSLSWRRWRCSVLEECEVCHKLGLRLLVWAVSSTSPCLTPSESLCSPQWRQQLFAPSRR